MLKSNKYWNINNTGKKTFWFYLTYYLQKNAKTEIKVVSYLHGKLCKLLHKN